MKVKNLMIMTIASLILISSYAAFVQLGLEKEEVKLQRNNSSFEWETNPQVELKKIWKLNKGYWS